MGFRLMSLSEVELGEFNVTGLSDFEIAMGARNDGNGMACTLDDRSFVGADETVGGGLSKGLTQDAKVKALRGLGEYNVFAGDGGCDECAVSGAFNLLDGVNSWKADDGCAMLHDCVNSAINGDGVDEGAYCVVDEDDVVVSYGNGCGERGESIGDGLLTVFSTCDNADPRLEAGVCNEKMRVLKLVRLHCDDDLGDASDRGESA